jgi:phenylpropionate dioxygenase-like ring-hydroxylating dioxygenase large terminal subunit
MSVQPATFPSEQWYVLADRVELDALGDGLLARQVCGQHLVVFRQADGTPVVLDDRCSHRGYPLSASDRIGDTIQCGYHGLQFEPSGACVWAPGQERIPSRANIVARPVVERGPWLWVWMGDPANPDHDRLPALPWLDSADWAVVYGMEPLPSRYGLLVDNLLDLSHETFLHAGYIGTPEVAESPVTTTVDEANGVVYASRRMEAVECPPFYSKSTGLSTPIDRWQDIEYHAPGCYLLHVRVAPAGAADDSRAARVEVLYGITPVDDHHTLDFWAVCRDFALDDPDVDAFVSQMNRDVVLQDVAALSMIEQRLGDDWSPPEVSFKIDAGGLAARRVLTQQIVAEQQSQPVTIR